MDTIIEGKQIYTDKNIEGCLAETVIDIQKELTAVKSSFVQDIISH